MGVGEKFSGLGGSTGIRTIAPEHIKDINPEFYGLKEKNVNATQYAFCPAYRDYLKNLYVIRSPFDYDLHIRNERIETSFYKQKDFDDLIHIRSLPDRLISLSLNLYLFTMEDSLLLSQEGATLHSSNFVDNTIVVPGKFDLGKWPRPLELAFHMKSESFKINWEDPLYYMRFHTQENIQFKHFIVSKRYYDLSIALAKAKTYKSTFSKLDFFYKLTSKYHKIKDLMMREIEANLLE